MASQQCCGDALYFHKHATFPLVIFDHILYTKGIWRAWWSCNENAPDSRVPVRNCSVKCENEPIFHAKWPRAAEGARSLGYPFAYTNLCFVWSRSLLIGLHTVDDSSTIQPIWDWKFGLVLPGSVRRGRVKENLPSKLLFCWWGSMESLSWIACQGILSSAVFMDLLKSHINSTSCSLDIA